MGFLTKPQVTQVDPNPDFLSGVQGAGTDLLITEFANPGQTFGGLTSELQRQSTGGIQQFLSQPSPEQQTLDLLQPSLLSLVGQGTQGIGGFDQSQALIGAASENFGRNLNTALGSLSNRAPGRFSTAFGAQGRDLASQALQDFNLFQQQALQAGLGLDLQARDLSQQGVLGASSLLGTLSGQAGQAPFNRLLGAGQLGLAQTGQAIDPSLQLMLGGLRFARPFPLDAAIGDSLFSQLGNLGLSAAALTGAGPFGGGG